MRKIVLNIPDNQYSFFLELISNLKFVKITQTGDERESLQNIEEGLKEIKLIEEGKLTSRAAKDFLNEL